MFRYIILVLFVFMASASSALGDVHEIIIDDTGYHPKEVQIVLGDTVKWTNKGTTIHSISDKIGSFDSGPLSPGLTYERTFADPPDCGGKITIADHPGHKIEGFSNPQFVEYCDHKNDFCGKIAVYIAKFEISPRDSTFVKNQPIIMTIFFDGDYGEYNKFKIILDGNIIFEGSARDLEGALGPGCLECAKVACPYENAVGWLPPLCKGYSDFITFFLSPDTFSSGIHTIGIEAPFYRNDKQISTIRDSVRYEILPYHPAEVFWW